MFAALLTCITASLGATALNLEVQPGQMLNTIDEKVYGHFFEHIYHSANGGLWGEMVWNRSFEESPADYGLWFLEAGDVTQEGQGTNLRLPFGDVAWADYELTLEAQKTGGQEGFLILFRVAGDDDFYWYNLGGWGNSRHALERGVSGQGRWGQVGPSVPGKIEKDRWYAIRVRCEGPRLQVWLDGEQMLDFTDEEHPHLAGRVGVGTWSTQARFRNLRVTSLDGAALHEGPPELPERSGGVRFWEGYGTGTFKPSTGEPLNSDCCVELHGKGGETGLEQTPFCLRAGETYKGSLWARGEASGGLVVRLTGGGIQLAEQSLTAPGAEWAEFPFTFKPSANCSAATLQVGLTGEGTVWLDQVSLMPERARQEGGFRPDLLKAIADLRPPIIRWPGGCFAEFYRWKDGIGPQHKRVKYPISIWEDQDTNSLGTDEFIDLCRRVGAEPLIVVNIGSHEEESERAAYIEEACQWIEYCNGAADTEWGKVRAANGHPEPYGVQYWEIDNETWFMGVERYIEAVQQFAPAMRKADPSIKLAACGSAGFDLGWNRAIIEACAPLIDYCSIHHYENPDAFAEGPNNYEKFFRKTAKLIAESANPNLKIYVSEWNAQSTDWRTGLYCGGLLNAFERCGDFLEIGGPALFLRHLSATDWDNAFVNFDQCTCFPAPNYVVMKLWREHYAPNRIALDGDAGPLDIVATQSQDGRTLHIKAVNSGDTPVDLKVTVKDLPLITARFEIVAPGSLAERNTLNAPNRIAPKDALAPIDAGAVTVHLPPYAAGCLTLAVRPPL